MPRKGKKTSQSLDVATKNFVLGSDLLAKHPMFAPMYHRARVVRYEGSQNLCPATGWAVVTANGIIYVHPTRRAEPEEWVYVLAHCLLHLGFSHFQSRLKPREWEAACNCIVAKFIADLKLGRAPEELRSLPPFSARNEEGLYQEFCETGIPGEFQQLGTAGPNNGDMIVESVRTTWRGKIDWAGSFGLGLIAAVTSAVSVAAGREEYLGANENLMSLPQQVLRWFIDRYPLLGSLAANFTVIEEPLICGRLDISVAAVDPEAQELFVNPAAGLNERECRFVIGHELLHVGLCHQSRRQWRDPYLWNVACDFLCNAWLLEMGLGELPAVGGLYDPALKGMSAEAIYDLIVTDLRRYRKLATLRGVGLGDILERGGPDWWSTREGMALDDFYRRCLAQGLTYHEELGRGYLPLGLVEEIRALGQPPIPWDVALGMWFDEQFMPLEKTRTYARPSRRQSSSPDIALPRWVVPIDTRNSRVFGVILDTSGSMERKLLAKALGSIASYSMSRDVVLVRLVFCDAAPYDQGYVAPEDIAGLVKVRGRGGTTLQPGIDLLDRDEGFPKDAPLLIITDGLCDRLQVRREHAYLMPEGHSLPFVAKGPVFRIR